MTSARSVALAAAVEAFRSCGYLWREAVSLIELEAIPGPAASGIHLDRAVALIREHFPQSFVGRRLGPWARAAVDPLVAMLTPAERAVLRHILEGRSQKEIAETTGRAYNTVRTQVQSLHRKLGTSSDLQIVVACARRGIGAPSWGFAANTESTPRAAYSRVAPYFRGGGRRGTGGRRPGSLPASRAAIHFPHVTQRRRRSARSRRRSERSASRIAATRDA